jgi:hypothetical protein
MAATGGDSVIPGGYDPRGAASTEQLTTNVAARSSSSIGSKETTQA